MRSPRILMVAAELAPMAKVGGLADVTGTLPWALGEAGAEVTVAIPLYRALADTFEAPVTLNQRPIEMSWGSKSSYLLRVLSTRHLDGFGVLLVSCPELYDREGIYADPSSGEEFGDSLARWAGLCRGALVGAQLLGGEWDVVHAHDMQAGLALPLLRESFCNGSLATATAVLSVHNLLHQGFYPLKEVRRLGLPIERSEPLGPLEYHGELNLLKAGLEYADGIITVSPGYASEILNDPLAGHGLSGVLRARKDRVTGILNGIDERAWNPRTDSNLPSTYSAGELEGKADCRAHLERLCGWEPDPVRPLLGVVTRIVWQKGTDLLVGALDHLASTGARVVVLGQGDSGLEAELMEAAAARPELLHVVLKHDDPLAHQIYAGCDMFVMPSRFEPCGLTQMYAMRYGAVPIASRTGGLADTVLDLEEAGDRATGFLFSGATADGLGACVARAVETWSARRGLWSRLVSNGMAEDFSWCRAALGYLDLYAQLGEERMALRTGGGRG